MTYAQTTPPSAEPLTLAEVKAHLRLDGSDEDALLASLISTAREHLERETGLCLISSLAALSRPLAGEWGDPDFEIAGARDSERYDLRY